MAHVPSVFYACSQYMQYGLLPAFRVGKVGQITERASGVLRLPMARSQESEDYCI